MNERISLDDFFLSNDVIKVSGADDIDKSEDHFIFVGNVNCPHSQIGTAHFESACRVEEEDRERKCYELDLSKDGSRKIAEDIGLPNIQGVPSMLRWNAKNKVYETAAEGRRMSYQYNEVFKDFEEGGI